MKVMEEKERGEEEEEKGINSSNFNLIVLK